MDCSEYIDEEYDKQREALLKYYEGDIIKMTKFLDAYVVRNLLWNYHVWALNESQKALAEKDVEKERFLDGLHMELIGIGMKVLDENANMGVDILKKDDGSYKIPRVEELRYIETVSHPNRSKNSPLNKRKEDTTPWTPRNIPSLTNQKPQPPSPLPTHRRTHFPRHHTKQISSHRNNTASPINSSLDAKDLHTSFSALISGYPCS